MEKYTPELRTKLMEYETSTRAVIPLPGGGSILTLGFPGLAFDIRGGTYIDPERMDATLSDPKLSGCRLLVVLLEADELPEDAWHLLSKATGARSIAVAHLPIMDYEAPDSAFLHTWYGMAPGVNGVLDAGNSVGLACHYGAGRSGTVAASMLMDRGWSARAAIDLIRSKFADSIESEKQLRWLYCRDGSAVNRDLT